MTSYIVLKNINRTVCNWRFRIVKCTRNYQFFPLIHRKLFESTIKLSEVFLQTPYGEHIIIRFYNTSFKSTKQKSILSKKSQIVLVFPHFLTQKTPWMSKSLYFIFWRKFRHLKPFKQLQFPNIFLMIEILHQILLFFFWFFWPGNHKSWFKWSLRNLL